MSEKELLWVIAFVSIYIIMPIVIALSLLVPMFTRWRTKRKGEVASKGDSVEETGKEE